ncbi:MAG: hypothetical protein AAF843_01670 [Bacteroidota bacterium]
MNIEIVNIRSDKIISAFKEVMERYTSLHDCHILLVQKKIKSSTMQAQPIFNFKSLLKGVKTYKVKLGIYVRDSDTLRVESLPKDVLTGWFAHELGHIVDYQPYSSWQMLRYGIRYVTSQKFKRKAEYAADTIAIAHGFAPQIIAAKKFIIENELMEQKYKDKIAKYYMTISEVELCVDEKAIAQPSTEL